MSCSVSRRRVLAWFAFSVLAALSLAADTHSHKAGAQSEEGVVVIINARNPTNTLAVAEVRKLFLGQTAFWHGVVPVKAVVRPESSAPAKAFFSLIGISGQAFQKQWDELQLAGRGVAPKSLGSIQDVATAVSQVPGGIGYALASEAWSVQLKGVKVIPLR
jgi:hypothetical protein